MLGSYKRSKCKHGSKERYKKYYYTPNSVRCITDVGIEQSLGITSVCKGNELQNRCMEAVRVGQRKQLEQT